ncbi:helix-turn-helix domain-containing protein [Microbulbifer sp. 2205BS26-8]|uniref:AraC family transcriptional regulator n=1 Tax=Microbulbifer sp. 2205BS26-8 TaxID=3064386 RepID=UPI00273F69C4|nr:helix-turn-helix domain-containing protein [Microbulbifer sp. 2205BS26-8]MDP5210767.1 helix-turn-helix domain-containing protein [Microbulbifer sp. 2205BS26-8]
MKYESIIAQITTQQIIAMFDLLSDLIFWIKDDTGRVIHCNQEFVRHVGRKSIGQVLGHSDLDFSPTYLARNFMMDDQRVMAGEIITERLELNIGRSGELAWFTTSKRPLKNAQGEIIGTYGVARNLKKTVKTLSGMEKIKKPVEYIKNNYVRNITIEELAEVASLSVSALERRFKKYLKKTPMQFLREIRLENSRRMLVETQMPVSEIAYSSGFASHSYFSRHFKAMFGFLPANYRAEVQLES